MIKETELIGYKNRKLYCRYTDLTDSPDAILLLIHGMQEHCARYDEFAEMLAKENVIFFATDLRGHGKNIIGRAGLDDGDIYSNIVEDQKEVIKFIRSKYKDTPIILMGHSYGSFITQRFVRDEDKNISRIILCGSNYMNTPLIKFARIIAFFSKILKGRSADAKLIEKLSIKGYGNAFENGNWLSRDDEVIIKYNGDELCGQTFPVAFFESMFQNVTKNYKNIKCSSDILLISGTDDPVGEFGKGVKKLKKVYADNGLDVTMKLYEGARHELLNETNRQEVFSDILDFIKQ